MRKRAQERLYVDKTPLLSRKISDSDRTIKK